MKKLHFNQLKYVLPLILLPFSAIAFWGTKDSFTSKEITKETTTREINATLQDPDMERTQTLNKFDALFEAYDSKEDFSAIKGIEDEEDKNLELDNKDLYSMTEMERLEQQNREGVLSVPKIKDVSNFEVYKNATMPTAPTSNSNYPIYTVPRNNRVGGNTSSNTYDNAPSGFQNYTQKTEPQSRFEEEMALFKAQMSMIDSMTNKNTSLTNKPKSNIEPSISDVKETIEAKTAHETLPLSIVRKAGGQKSTQIGQDISINNRQYFNTLGDNRRHDFIKAILDEGLKVYDGSRVRIRLLDDIVIDNIPLSKGSYLFGIISGFATQRVFIDITNVIYDNRILNVKLSVYDFDGMRGLYIPESLFRDISKEAGSQSVSQNLSFSSGTDINATQLAYKAAQDAYRSSTRAMSDAIRKRKAILKYNTLIYLVGDNK